MRQWSAKTRHQEGTLTSRHNSASIGADGVAELQLHSAPAIDLSVHDRPPEQTSCDASALGGRFTRRNPSKPIEGSQP